MKQTLINDVVQGMLPFLDNGQIEELQKVLKHALFKVEIQEKNPPKLEEIVAENRIYHSQAGRIGAGFFHASGRLGRHGGSCRADGRISADAGGGEPGRCL